MKILKNRIFAVGATILIMIASTLTNVHSTLGAECRTIADSFYNGVFNDSWGTASRSIQSQLDRRCEAANGLATMVTNYPELSDFATLLREKRTAILNTQGIADKYSANVDLQVAFNTLYSALDELSLTARDREMLSEYGGIFRGAQNVILNSGYNEAVREFARTTLDVFPANILIRAAGLEPLELFE